MTRNDLCVCSDRPGSVADKKLRLRNALKFPNMHDKCLRIQRMPVPTRCPHASISKMMLCRINEETFGQRNARIGIVNRNEALPPWLYQRWIVHVVVKPPIQDVQPRPVELWLRELPLSPKSTTHVRSLMHGLVEFAMWAGLLDISPQSNLPGPKQRSNTKGTQGTEPHGGAIQRSAERAA